MKIEDFERIVWNLANKGYVRYWLGLDSEKMILQFLIYDDGVLKPHQVDGMEEEGFKWDSNLESYLIDRTR